VSWLFDKTDVTARFWHHYFATAGKSLQMANTLDDKKNQTTEQPAAPNPQPDIAGRDATAAAGDAGDTSTVDRDAGNLEHGETGGHNFSSEEA
jgi:hypothetical protein